MAQATGLQNRRRIYRLGHAESDLLCIIAWCVVRVPVEEYAGWHAAPIQLRCIKMMVAAHAKCR